MNFLSSELNHNFNSSRRANKKWKILDPSWFTKIYQIIKVPPSWFTVVHTSLKYGKLIEDPLTRDFFKLRTRTWTRTKSRLRTRTRVRTGACPKTSDTDSDTDKTRTRVSAHLCYWLWPIVESKYEESNALISIYHFPNIISFLIHFRLFLGWRGIIVTLKSYVILYELSSGSNNEFLSFESKWNLCVKYSYSWALMIYITLEWTLEYN